MVSPGAYPELLLETGRKIARVREPDHVAHLRHVVGVGRQQLRRTLHAGVAQRSIGDLPTMLWIRMFSTERDTRISRAKTSSENSSLGIFCPMTSVTRLMNFSSADSTTISSRLPSICPILSFRCRSAWRLTNCRTRARNNSTSKGFSIQASTPASQNIRASRAYRPP